MRSSPRSCARKGRSRLRSCRRKVRRQAIDTVFRAIHEGDADPKLLAYQYLQVLPQIAQGESNKVWIIPSEVTQALGQFTDRAAGRDERRRARA